MPFFHVPFFHVPFFHVPLFHVPFFHVPLFLVSSGGLEPPGGGGRVRSDHPSLGDGCGGMSGDCIGKGTCAKVTLRSGGDEGLS